GPYPSSGCLLALAWLILLRGSCSPDWSLSPQVPQRMAESGPADGSGGAPGVWGSWGPWSACSRSCSGGVKEQTRPCLPSSPARGLAVSGHVVSAVRASVPLHRPREDTG
uniref:Uncharacterized protein n=1 Tax=Cavia porcellus TaxID=10141 RepID=A0A286Y636_CAVPO